MQAVQLSLCVHFTSILCATFAHVLEELRPDALVLRAGSVRDVAKLRVAVERSRSDWGLSALSVFATNGRHDESVVETKRRLIDESKVPHSKVQFAVYEHLVQAGFQLILDTSDGQADCHYNVPFPDVSSDRLLQAFIDTFSEPQDKNEI